MSAHNSVLILLLIHLLSLVAFSSTECVPVFLWGNMQYSDLVSPLKKINQESFTDILENQLDKKSPLVVFLEQTLSPEDFIPEDRTGKSIFISLANLKGSTAVNYLQCVKNPIEAITGLKERNIVRTTVDKILNAPAKVQSGDVLLIPMYDANENENRVDMLHRHDRNMASIYSYLKDHKDIVMLYTAYNPSWITSEEIRSHRHIRDISKANDTAETDIKYIVIKNNDILISTQAGPTLACNGTLVSLDTFSDIRTENKTDEGMDIVLTSPTVTHITLTLKFVFAGGYWIMQNITVLNATAQEEKDKEYYFRVKELYAPEQFSYHCSNQAFYFPKNHNQNLTFRELQLQPFVNISNITFGSPYDCVGFMSAPIWSGLFVTIILVLIMTCGLTMMMDIKTMDRFDDPKGKTITVTATE